MNLNVSHPQVPSTLQFLPGAPRRKLSLSPSCCCEAALLPGWGMEVCCWCEWRWCAGAGASAGRRHMVARPEFYFLAIYRRLSTVFPALRIWTPGHRASRLTLIKTPWCWMILVSSSSACTLVMESASRGFWCLLRWLSRLVYLYSMVSGDPTVQSVIWTCLENSSSTFSSKVKGPQDGCSVSNDHFRKTLSFLTKTWHRYSVRQKLGFLLQSSPQSVGLRRPWIPKRWTLE